MAFRPGTEQRANVPKDNGRGHLYVRKCFQRRVQLQCEEHGGDREFNVLLLRDFFHLEVTRFRSQQK